MLNKIWDYLICINCILFFIYILHSISMFFGIGVVKCKHVKGHLTLAYWEFCCKTSNSCLKNSLLFSLKIPRNDFFFNHPV